MTENTTPNRTPPSATMIAGVLMFAIAALAGTVTAGSCTPPSPAQVAKAESDLCKLRALERATIALSDGKLEPEPGSVRANVARAVDELCAARATDAGTDGGK